MAVTETTTNDNSKELLDVTSGYGDKFDALSDLTTYRQLLKNLKDDLEKKADKFKIRILRIISAVIISSLLISYSIMWLTQSDLVMFIIVLAEMSFLIIFAAFVPQLTKIERYEVHKKIIQDKVIINQLLDISNNLLICSRTILDKKNGRKITVSYTPHKGNYGELMHRIKNFQKKDQLEVIGLLERNSISLWVEGLYSTYSKHELYRFVISVLLSDLMIEYPISPEFQQLETEIKTRSIIDYDGKYLNERPEWTKQFETIE